MIRQLVILIKKTFIEIRSALSIHHFKELFIGFLMVLRTIENDVAKVHEFKG